MNDSIGHGADHPRRYRSKPTEVEAVQVTKENVGLVAAWCEGLVGSRPDVDEDREYVVVPTINGAANALIGHFVIEGPNDFYPCDPDTFTARWEAI
jgi:hypothetical protein